MGGVKNCGGWDKILRYENRTKKNNIFFSTQTDERASNLSDTISEIYNKRFKVVRTLASKKLQNNIFMAQFCVANRTICTTILSYITNH